MLIAASVDDCGGFPLITDEVGFDSTIEMESVLLEGNRVEVVLHVEPCGSDVMDA